jgi:hypothetical protein
VTIGEPFEDTRRGEIDIRCADYLLTIGIIDMRSQKKKKV